MSRTAGFASVWGRAGCSAWLGDSVGVRYAAVVLGARLARVGSEELRGSGFGGSGFVGDHDDGFGGDFYADLVAEAEQDRKSVV